MSRIIVKNIPKNSTENELKDFFSSKGDVTDVKIISTKDGKSRNFAYIGFKSENQAKVAIKYYNNSYLKTNRLNVEEALTQYDKKLKKPWSKHSTWNKEKSNSTLKLNENSENKATIKDTKSKIAQLKEISKVTSTKFKFDVFEGIEKDEEKDKENKSKIEELQDYDPKRLYIRNLSFQITEDELRDCFAKYGNVVEYSVPRDRNKNSFGYGFVTYETMESAILAMEALDKKLFQGRILHITPAKAKDVKPSLAITDLTNTQLRNKKTSFKKEKLLKLKKDYDQEITWNFLFLNMNTVIDAVSKQTGLEKKDILDKDNSKLAVEVSAMETVMINKTKDWLESQGLDLKPFNTKRLNCARSKTVILIKNIGSEVKEEFLKKLFSHYGTLSQFILSPQNVIGIAEFIDSKNAENCYKNLSYYEINGLPLYLEYAPIGFKISNNESDFKEEKKINEGEINFEQGNVLFIKNLSFDTSESSLLAFFKKYQPSSVKIVKSKTDKNLSAGFGFVEFPNSDFADKAIKNLQGEILDGHSLKINKAKGQESKKENTNEVLLARKRKTEKYAEEEVNQEDINDDKLLVKNIAFEATKEELRDLFKQFGDVKNVRLPNKSTGVHKGFAFVEFLTHEEAKKAFNKLANTHFYGRKLVIEWAKKDKTIEEMREETQKKLNSLKVETHRKKNKAEIEI